jgi:hypothetical protein
VKNLLNFQCHKVEKKNLGLNMPLANDEEPLVSNNCEEEAMS